MAFYELSNSDTYTCAGLGSRRGGETPLGAERKMPDSSGVRGFGEFDEFSAIAFLTWYWKSWRRIMREVGSTVNSTFFLKVLQHLGAATWRHGDTRVCVCTMSRLQDAEYPRITTMGNNSSSSQYPPLGFFFRLSLQEVSICGVWCFTLQSQT